MKTSDVRVIRVIRWPFFQGAFRQILLFAVALNTGLAAEPVARVMGRNITLKEISPPAEQVKKQRATPSAATMEKWLFDWRHERLVALIWQPLQQEFCKTHDCQPTHKEIDELNKALRRANEKDIQESQQRLVQIEAKLRTGSLSEKERLPLISEKRVVEQYLENLLRQKAEDHDPEGQKIRDDVSRTYVEAWKVNRALYHKYGGRVIYQQAGIEPLDAYRQFLQEYEKKGAFQIFDPAQRREFWKYFTTMPHTFLRPGEFDFERPWWKKKLTGD